MNRPALIVALVAGCCARPAAPLYAVSVPRTDGVFEVQVQCEGAGQGVATAFAVGPHRLLTAAHVVGVLASAHGRAWRRCSDTPMVTLRVRGRDVKGVTVLRQDDAHDLALLELPPGETLAAAEPTLASVPAIGAPVCHVYARPFQGTACGNYLGVFERPDDNGKMSAPTHPGNSGGPVYDADGNLIGVTTALVNPDGDKGGFFTTIADRADILRP